MGDLNQRYNSYYKKVVVINEGEKFCPKCDGKGQIVEGKNFILKRLLRIPLICNKCLGDGKLDWIEQATGKQRKEFRDGTNKRTNTTGPR